MAYSFIVVEGIDGSGKNTQIENIKSYIRKKRQRVSVIKFPTENARKVHEHLQKKVSMEQKELFEAFLDDIKSMQKEIRNKLRLGWVIADRYCISTAAYQSVDLDIKKRMDEIEKSSLIKPDYLIWLDVDAKEGAKRKRKQGASSRFDEDIEFLQKVRENYLYLYKRDFMCSNWRRINANLDSKKVFTEILAVLERNSKAEEVE